MCVYVLGVSGSQCHLSCEQTYLCSGQQQLQATSLCAISDSLDKQMYIITFTHTYLLVLSPLPLNRKESTETLCQKKKKKKKKKKQCLICFLSHLVKDTLSHHHEDQCHTTIVYINHAYKLTHICKLY